MELAPFVVAGIIALALMFDFTNGFHDAANSTATVVATKALKPKTAVYMAAFFNFAALFVVGTAVANTVAKTVKVDTLGNGPGGLPLGLSVTFSALLAAIFWNYLTWSVGLPSSSSHALIGGLVGAGLAAGGPDAIEWSSVRNTVIAIFASPAVAFSVAFLAMYLVFALQRATKWEDDAEPFKWLQIVSSAAVSFGHGANDAQKTMGVMAATLVAGGYMTEGDELPLWMELAAYGMISIGTMWGGWAIIETMGLRITQLTASSGVAANIGASTAIFGATDLGIPISTTHAAASSVMGAGVSAGTGINGKKVGEMATAWLITVPAVGLVGFLAFQLTRLVDPWGMLASIAMVIVLVTWAYRLMSHSQNAEDIEAMLPPDEALHEIHPTGHPDLHPYQGPPHVNHHHPETLAHPSSGPQPPAGPRPGPTATP
jgi:inorganic phosphate transporter, PiT family